MDYSATIKDTVKESVKIPKYFYEIIKRKIKKV